MRKHYRTRSKAPASDEPWIYNPSRVNKHKSQQVMSHSHGSLLETSCLPVSNSVKRSSSPIQSHSVDSVLNRRNSLIQFKRSDDLSEFQVNQSRQNPLIQFKRSDELSEFQVNQSRQNPMTQFKRSDAHSEFQVSQSSRQNSVIKLKHPGDSSVNQPSPILKKTDSQSDCQISPLSDQVKFPENQDSPVHYLQSNSPLNNFDLSQEDQTLTLKSLHELLSIGRETLTCRKRGKKSNFMCYKRREYSEISSTNGLSST